MRDPESQEGLKRVVAQVAALALLHSYPESQEGLKRGAGRRGVAVGVAAARISRRVETLTQP